MFAEQCIYLTRTENLDWKVSLLFGSSFFFFVIFLLLVQLIKLNFLFLDLVRFPRLGTIPMATFQAAVPSHHSVTFITCKEGAAYQRISSQLLNGNDQTSRDHLPSLSLLIDASKTMDKWMGDNFLFSIQVARSLLIIKGTLCNLMV
jgi:hypothetical protein